jgi:metal-sulfur cluster biosynthetic enzyme
MALTEEQIREALKQVIDPELFINIIDLGLVYNVTTAPAADVAVIAASAPGNATSDAVTQGAAVPATHDCSSHGHAHAHEKSEPCNHDHAAATTPAVLDLAAAAAKGEATAAQPLVGSCCGEQTTEAGPKEDIFIDMTMTSPACPAGPQLIGNTKQVLGRLPGVNKVEVKIVMVPPWTPDKMTEEARDQLGIF